ncbi:uncharacterized protein LOC124634007 [Helicoverpa zea]|uniref:uncharacterized protein LOC124634007 n=1 Tax=Helicoverpa zea TaxID=7113 RepID=UPI001F59AC9F|nr:uncharacterized protein LOC124634007 [Helicoverpa zea]
MATVVITFFLFVRFYVCKMDADCIEHQRDQLLSRREKRWSMNSQRLEEIVAELMKPISDVRRSFDTDLSALLEEYLTEAGLRALDAGEDASAADAVAPNFAELALLLQQSANIYGRKVDFLYQHVLDVSEALQASAAEARAADAAEAEAGAADSGPRRRRRPSSWLSGELQHIELTMSATARRDAAPARPPPTLPRLYIDLEPRVITDADAPLHDYDGEPIGLLSDFQVAWRLHRGLLVDELEHGAEQPRALRPISLLQLQAALDAAAPAAPDAPGPPQRASTPLPPGATLDCTADCTADCAADSAADSAIADVSGSLVDLTPQHPPRRGKKRRSEAHIDDIVEGSVRITIGEELRQRLMVIEEFSVPSKWIKKVVGKRKSDILSERRRLREQDPDSRAEFPGWSGAEAAAATAEARADSDDDGFFEQSSVGSDASGEAAGWRARARAAGARALDVRALGGAVLAALRPRARPFRALLRDAAAAPADVSRLFLATLFLANAGNVEVLPGPPLSLDSFSLRLVSAEPRLAAADVAELAC